MNVFQAGKSVVQWSEFLPTDPEVRVRFSALPDFLGSNGIFGPMRDEVTGE
jgi:hypothetical protein